MSSTKSYAAQSATTPLAPFTIERRNPGPHDVQIQILYCGVCHSDLHTARNEWGGTIYPCVPGHEIVGKVTEVGDPTGIGCLVDNCRECDNCHEGPEKYCTYGFVGTYGEVAGFHAKEQKRNEKFVINVCVTMPVNNYFHLILHPIPGLCISGTG